MEVMLGGREIWDICIFHSSYLLRFHVYYTFKLDYTYDLISMHNLCDWTFSLQRSSQQPDWVEWRPPQCWIVPFFFVVWPHQFNVTPQGSINLSSMLQQTRLCISIWLLFLCSAFGAIVSTEQQAGNHNLNFFVCLSMNLKTCYFTIITIPGILFHCVEINTLYDGLF